MIRHILGLFIPSFRTAAERRQSNQLIRGKYPPRVDSDGNYRCHCDPENRITSIKNRPVHAPGRRFGWTVPWLITRYSHGDTTYICEDQCLRDEPGGTLTVFVDMLSADDIVIYTDDESKFGYEDGSPNEWDMDAYNFRACRVKPLSEMLNEKAIERL